MDDFAAQIIDRETALANFDHARDDFENALGLAPVEALDYKPEGDDYSIADLVPHCTHAIQRYNRLLDAIEEAEYQEVREAAGDEHDELLQRHRAARLDAGSRGTAGKSALDELDAAHDRLATRLRELAQEEYARAAPVYYPGSDEPYPTRAMDIVGWLTDHYQEHVPHVTQMLEAWKKTKGDNFA